MATTRRFDKDGFRAIESGRYEAGRLVAAVRRFHGESGNEVGSEQAAAVHDLRSDTSLGRAWLLAVPGAMDAGIAAPLFRASLAVAPAVAALAAFPAIRRLAARGRGHAAVHAHRGHRHWAAPLASTYWAGARILVPRTAASGGRSDHRVRPRPGLGTAGAGQPPPTRPLYAGNDRGGGPAG